MFVIYEVLLMIRHQISMMTRRRIGDVQLSKSKMTFFLHAYTWLCQEELIVINDGADYYSRLVPVSYFESRESSFGINRWDKYHMMKSVEFFS